MSKLNLRPVTKSYQVFLACSECNHDMVPDDPPYVVLYDQVVFRYICPECNHTTLNSTRYPFIHVESDENFTITVDEDDL